MTLFQNHSSQITISTAGIVLVGPYLKTLFSHLGLLDEDKFKSIECQKKAILLMHYIVSGNKTIVLEDEIGLYKVLSGLSPLDEFKFEMELNEDEIRLVDSMIVSLLKQWQTLSTSSIESFRENFLIRTADLMEDENAFILLVDNKPYDILMNTIPWEYKSIKFPWMNRIVLISWN